jgi:hypothetical protein
VGLLLQPFRHPHSWHHKLLIFKCNRICLGAPMLARNRLKAQPAMSAGQLTMTQYHVTPEPRREYSHTTHAPAWSVPTFRSLVKLRHMHQKTRVVARCNGVQNPCCIGWQWVLNSTHSTYCIIGVWTDLQSVGFCMQCLNSASLPACKILNAYLSRVPIQLYAPLQTRGWQNETWSTNVIFCTGKHGNAIKG